MKASIYSQIMNLEEHEIDKKFIALENVVEALEYVSLEQKYV